MDGNRRWAKKNFLPKLAGHKIGADNIVRVIEHASDKGIGYVTLWALSTENLVNRDENELKGIITIINNIESYLGKMIQKGLRFETIGDLSKLPEESQNVLFDIKDKTKNNTGITVVLALAYGGQDEIIRGIKKFLALGEDINTLTTKNFRKYLDVSDFPTPDLIIRTGGDVRHSGFLLYDSAYTEYYYTQKMWPEFNEDDLEKALDFFHKTKRNFGK
ncbi:MAG: di-trans,poly-cis-decaprenylcistransferase [Candidatus Gracilibacteria bacterium]|nr:di-trans,poly-cis-decaprenylcistransferase [Candidatus Gracilibacteria bacterium]